MGVIFHILFPEVPIVSQWCLKNLKDKISARRPLSSDLTHTHCTYCTNMSQFPEVPELDTDL